MKSIRALFILSITALWLLAGCQPPNPPSETNTGYTVTFDGNGNTDGTAPQDPTHYQTGQTVTVPGNTGGLIRTGFSFTGWNTLADGSGTTYAQGAAFTMGGAGVTLHARWTTNPVFTVIYDGNGNSGGITPQDTTNYEEGQTVTVPGNTGGLIRTGFSFTGWNTLANGSGTTYTQGASFAISAADVTLYARWTANPAFTVTYDGNGNTAGTAPEDSTHYETGRTVTVFGNTGNLVRTGYTFYGWNTNSDGSGTDYAPGDTFAMGAADVTLYAGWTPTGSTPGGITGTVKDYITGQGIAGATVSLGNRTALTDSNGAFSFAYTPAVIVTGDLFVYKGLDHQFTGMCGVQIDTAAYPDYTFHLLPKSPTGYPTVTISGALPGTATDDGRVNWTVINSLGGHFMLQDNLEDGDTTYSVSVPTTGADCFISIRCDVDESGGPAPEIVQYYSHQNLTANLTLNIVELTPKTTVTLTGNADGGRIFGDLDLGLVDMPRYMDVLVMAGPSMDVSIYNPDSYPMIWKIMSHRQGPITMEGKFSIGNSTPFSSTAALPASPDTIPLPLGLNSNCQWNAASRVLSFTAGAGAVFHYCSFDDDNDNRGMIISSSSSITIPVDLYDDVFVPGTNWDVAAIPMCSNKSVSELIGSRFFLTTGYGDITDFRLGYIYMLDDSDDWPDLIP